MQRNRTITILLLSGSLLWGCGGPQAPDNPGTGTAGGSGALPKDLTGSACNPASGGIDSTTGTLSEGCKQGLGFPADSNGDCDSDGVPDLYDNPNDCRPKTDQVIDCNLDCQARRWVVSKEKDVQDSFTFGNNAIRLSTLENLNMSVSRQQFVVGSLTLVPSQALGNSLLRVLVRKGEKTLICDDVDLATSTPIYFVSEGTMTPQGGQTTNVRLEFCGAMGIPNASAANISLRLEHVPIVKWLAAATATKVINPSIVYANPYDANPNQEFLQMALVDPKSVTVNGQPKTIFGNLNFELQNKYQAFAGQLDDRGGVQVPVQSEVIKHAWKRAGSLEAQVSYSQGLMGIWYSCGNKYLNILDGC